MFVRKLVEKASKKHHIGGITGLRAEDVSPRLAFHYGVPADAALLAYDPALHVLAIATRNGQIKLFGRDNTQALLQSPSPVPCKFLRFAEGQGVLLNVNIWDIDTKKLWYVHPFEKEITAFSVLQNCLYIYVGDSFGNVSLLKLDLGQTCLVDMPYWIPFSESYGSGANVGNEVEVAFVLPQPLAENNRVLIIFRDGIMSLWDIHTSKVVSLSGKSMQQQSHQEAKTVTSACWACAKGSKIAIGFYSGDIYLWSIPDILNAQNLSSMSNQNLPLQRLNLGYKLDRVSIVSLRWVHSGGKAGRLYVNGFSDHAYLFQDYFSSLATKYPWFLSMKDKHQTSTGSADIHKTRNLYVTGHLDGTIRFWDASCPLLLQNLMIKQQNEDNSPSGTPITSLQFDMSSSILICGNRSGMVRIITFKKDSSDNRFSFLHAKQGESYNVRCIKLKGAVTSISLISNSKRVAVGTEKGIVSVVSIEDASILYQKQLDCRVSGGIASLQFEMYSHNGYDKNLLIVGMEDSTIFILEEESGKLLNTNPVQTNKPCRALLMQTLELSPDDPSVSDTHDTVSKESLLLLCTENAIRLFSLSHAIQGMKNIINKKKPNGSCCFASLIHSVSSEIGLLLVFSNGKIEIRSLPDLSILKEASLRGFAYTRNLNSSSSIACSSDGEIILVNGEETFFFSTLCQNDIYRHVDSINTIYRKDNSPREESSYVVKSPREKKKGIFGMIMKDTKASKGKQSDANGDEQFTATTSEELSSIFSCANFAPVSEKRNSSIKDDENIELDIDDINIDDNPQKQKGPHFPGLSKQKISKGFQSLREKLKPRTEERVNSGNRKPEDDTSISQVDQIKMKYGYATNDDSTSIPKMIGNKLQENIKKLEGINIRAGDMANGAQSFSAMAKELLQNTKNEKATS
uniref:Lethal giant larvae (Lgl)-like C-terminal domain-containing protein n=1 Tax=Oryza punctata TaxID=4537 RepID=A0A0E0KU02_ORYPU